MPKPKPDAFLPLKSNWFHILICLVEGEQHGYGIMQDVRERSGGKVRLWPATLYGSLNAGFMKRQTDRVSRSSLLERRPGCASCRGCRQYWCRRRRP